MQCKKVNIFEICKVERAVAGKIYTAGSCYVKLSAADEYVGQLKNDNTLDTRYAVFEPNEGICADYLHIAICNKFPEFLRKYRTTINLQFETLKHFVLDWHEKEEEQRYVVNAVKAVDNEIELTEIQIEKEKEMKKWYLAKMMAQQNQTPT